jgi:hypothetical protein
MYDPPYRNQIKTLQGEISGSHSGEYTTTQRNIPEDGHLKPKLRHL